MNAYESDTLRCTAITETKKRCTRTGTHDNGSGVLCEFHHKQHLVKKANDAPIVRKSK